MRGRTSYDLLAFLALADAIPLTALVEHVIRKSFDLDHFVTARAAGQHLALLNVVDVEGVSESLGLCQARHVRQPDILQTELALLAGHCLRNLSRQLMLL